MSIFRQLLYKWFGLEDPPCETCEVLRTQLAASERERRELLHKLLTPEPPSTTPVEKEELEPITPQFTPWRMRKQMLEAEDRKQAELLKAKAREIELNRGMANTKSVAELEKELGIPTGTEK